MRVLAEQNVGDHHSEQNEANLHDPHMRAYGRQDVHESDMDEGSCAEGEGVPQQRCRYVGGGELHEQCGEHGRNRRHGRKDGHVAKRYV